MKVFYHSGDLDGQCSGAIVKHAFPEAECIGINYGDLFPWDTIEVGEVVFMVDFCLQPFEDMLRLANLARLQWIDHHKTSLENAKATGFLCHYSGILDMDKAACELTWEFCYPNKEMPRSVFYLGRYDIWKHSEHPGALAFQYGMRSQEDTSPECQSFWANRFMDAQTNEIIALGRTLLAYEEQQNVKICKASAFDVVLDGLRCVAVNAALGNSLTFKSVYDPAKHDAMLCYYRKPAHWTVSLFTDKPDVDVSVVAKAHGGGGHKGAAGFQCATLPFLQET